jgi:hypothetical protein
MNWRERNENATHKRVGLFCVASTLGLGFWRLLFFKMRNWGRLQRFYETVQELRLAKLLVPVGDELTEELLAAEVAATAAAAAAAAAATFDP